MNHPNVLRIEGVASGLFPCCMVSRWMENGNVLEYLNQYQGHIDRLELVRSNQLTAYDWGSLIMAYQVTWYCPWVGLPPYP